MTTLSTIPHQALSKEAYTTALNHGFHADPSSDVRILYALIISEIYEAMDADRKLRHSKTAVMQFNEADMKSDEDFSAWYKATVSGTYEDELADIVIRLYDLAAHLSIRLDNGSNSHDRPFSDLDLSSPFPIFAYQFTRDIVLYLDKDTERIFLKVAINSVYCYAEAQQLDLYPHVLLKMRYNKLRPFRHGVRY